MGRVLNRSSGNDRESNMGRCRDTVLVRAVVGTRAVLVLAAVLVCGRAGILVTVLAARFEGVKEGSGIGLVMDLAFAQLA